MKAIAVKPGTPNTVHLTELPAPTVADVSGGRGVLVRVLRVGVDGTDKEINAAEYGQAPPGFDFLIIDAEHGCYTHAGIENIVRTCERVGMSSVVRSPARQSSTATALRLKIPYVAQCSAARHFRPSPDGSRQNAHSVGVYGRTER